MAEFGIAEGVGDGEVLGEEDYAGAFVQIVSDARARIYRYLDRYARVWYEVGVFVNIFASEFELSPRSIS